MPGCLENTWDSFCKSIMPLAQGRVKGISSSRLLRDAFCRSCGLPRAPPCPGTVTIRYWRAARDHISVLWRRYGAALSARQRGGEAALLSICSSDQQALEDCRCCRCLRSQARHTRSCHSSCSLNWLWILSSSYNALM
jgi:hypothetical protein